MSSLIPTFQAISCVVWTCGIVGSVVPQFVSILRPATVYGRLLDQTSIGAAPDASQVRGTAATLSTFFSSNGAKRAALKSLIKLAQSYTVPKRWFTWFYVVGSVVNISAALIAHGAGYPTWTFVLQALYQIHLIRRTLECLLIHKWSKEARMPVHLWIMGIVHYLCVPWSLIPACGGGPSFLSFTGVPSAMSLFFRAASAMKSGASASSIASSIPMGQAAASGVTMMRGVSAVSMGFGFIVGGNLVQALVHKALADLRMDANAGAGSKRNDDDALSASNQQDAAASRRRQVVASSSTSQRAAGSGMLMDVDIGDAASGASSSASTSSASVPRIVDPATESAALLQSNAARYPLPQGGFFEHAICPHYTAEICIYFGLFVAQMGLTTVLGPPSSTTCVDHHPVMSRLGGIMLVVWVAANLCVTGLRTKGWYLQMYPHAHRVRYTAAVIPYVL